MYRVQLSQFEGPLDLLLFFIRRDELDIYDIPIAHIADEYLAYVRLLKTIDLDGVGDFIYMAALLINIKARMLMPTPELDEEGEPIDPRRELVERLLEYVRFREAAEGLGSQEERRAEHFVRGDASAPLEHQQAEEPMPSGTIFDLVAALGRVLSEAPGEPVHAVRRESYTVEEQQAYVLAALGNGPRRFAALVEGRSKAFIIAAFLAVLELAREATIELLVPERPVDFELRRVASAQAHAV